MPDRYISKAEAAERVGLSTVTLWRMEDQGEFPARRQISRGRVAYLESEVDEWMASRGKSCGETPNPNAKSEAA
jgi:prophage regulatory protein